MSLMLKKNKYLQLFQSLTHANIKFKGPLILRMYGLLNDLNLINENRYILCNFIDQNSDLFEFRKDIYKYNHEYSLNQLFLFAYNKARAHQLLKNLYDEYINSINAIQNKIDTKPNLF